MTSGTWLARGHSLMASTKAWRACAEKPSSNVMCSRIGTRSCMRLACQFG